MGSHETVEMCGHAVGIGADAGDELEGVDGLEHGHAPAVERAAAAVARRLQERRVVRAINDVGDPQVRAQIFWEFVERRSGYDGYGASNAGIRLTAQRGR